MSGLLSGCTLHYLVKFYAMSTTLFLEIVTVLQAQEEAFTHPEISTQSQVDHCVDWDLPIQQ